MRFCSCCCGSGGASLWLAIAGAGALLAGSAFSVNWFDVPDANAPASSLQIEDPITGEWNGTVSGDTFPEDLQLFVVFKMDEDNVVVGSFYIPDDDDGAPFAGDFDAEDNILTGSVTTPEMGNWDLTLTLDEDTLEGDAVESESGQTATVTLERNDD